MRSVALGSLVYQFSLCMTYMILLQAMGKAVYVISASLMFGGGSDVSGCHLPVCSFGLKWLTDVCSGLRQVVEVTEHLSSIIPLVQRKDEFQQVANVCPLTAGDAKFSPEGKRAVKVRNP